MHYVTHFTHFLALLARSRSASFHNSEPKSGTHLVQIDTKPCYALFDFNTGQKLNLTFQGSFPSLSIHTPREFDIEFPETALAWAK